MSSTQHHKEIKVTATQRIVLDFQGFILESDDRIFDTRSYRNHTCLKYSAFLESVFVCVRDLACDPEKQLSYPSIETVLDDVIGVYNCYFRCVCWHRTQFEWIIEDVTASFELLRQAQQESNERSIWRDLCGNQGDNDKRQDNDSQNATNDECERRRRNLRRKR